MKKWTVVVEISDSSEGPFFSAQKVEEMVSDILDNSLTANLSWRIMETIEAPYGPQHPDGVFIADSSRKGNFRQ